MTARRHWLMLGLVDKTSLVDNFRLDATPKGVQARETTCP